MKRIGLFFATMLVALCMNAQDITLYYEDEEITKDNLEIELDMDKSVAINYIHIKNNKQEDLNLRVEVNKDGVSAGNMAQICMEPTCYEGNATDPVTIEAGETFDKFDVEYTYESGVSSTIVLSFIDNDADAVLKTLTVTYYDESAIRQAEKEKSLVLSAVARPNPATTTATFNYSVPAQYKNAKLIVRNALGSVVKTYSIKTGATGRISFNTSELANGVYFYSIVADERQLVTKKLVVKH